MNTGVGCHFLLQGIFPTQGLNPCLMSPALAGGFFTASTTWEALHHNDDIKFIFPAVSMCTFVIRRKKTMKLPLLLFLSPV